MELQGYVVMAITLLLMGYLLPHLVRSRQLLLESRVEDRFSGDLRILAVAGSPAPQDGRRETARPGHHARPVSRPYLHDPRRRPEAQMNRPGARTERAAQDARALAAARASRAARVSRRAAAARRRLVLTVTLLVLAVAAWVVVGAAGASVALGIVPTLLLGTVLVLGRRAAVRGAANDRLDRAEMAQLEARLRAVSRRAQIITPSRSTAAAPRTAAPTRDVVTESGTATTDGGATGVSGAAEPAVSAATPAETGGDGRPGTDVKAPAGQTPGADLEPPKMRGTDADEDAAVDPETGVEKAMAEEGAAEAVRPEEPWTPVPVPVPTYTLKPSAPRRDVAPLPAPEAAPAAALPQRPTAASPASATADEAPATTPALDLDAILARRRAAGE